jgi:phosphoribosylformimino-5-aminoimidazole carboxamide ribotide isomerase
LHLVDLDGARDGQVTNRQVIQAIVQAVAVPCELGGGIRDEREIEAWLTLGLRQLVLGTRALADADWFRRMARRFPDRLVLGIDARAGRVATDGWLKTSSVSAIELARSFQEEPLAAIVYTDIGRDGMLTGPNLEGMAEMKAAVDCPVIASGGVSALDDVVQLAAAGMDGCIIGRALYEGRFTLPAALAAAQSASAAAPGKAANG